MHIMKNLNTMTLLAAGTCAMIAASAANAAVVTVAGWDFSTIAGVTAPNPGTAEGFGAQNYAASVTASGLSVGGLNRASGLSSTLANGSASAAKGWGGQNIGNSSVNSATAISNSQYIYFTISTNASSNLSLSSIDAYNVRRSSKGPTAGLWQYAVGSGSYSDIGSVVAFGNVISSGGNSQTAISLATISSLQNIAASTTVTFRLLVWNQFGATPGTWYLNGQSATTDPDFKLSGEVTSVPAPGAIALLGVAGLIGSRRRR
jgi:MYXO-CTERM domain-containing protein